jgi:phosphatidate cytidylyltransferase
VLAARVATAAVLIAALLAALFLLPKAWFALLVFAIVALAGHEWARLCGFARPASWVYGLLVGLFSGFAHLEGTHQALFAASLFLWIAVVPAWLARGVKREHAVALAFAGPFLLVPTALALLSLRPHEVLLVMALVWIADSAAYFVGRAWGRRKLAPSISPGKTWEGALGGLAGALLYAIICGIFIERIAWAPYLALAMVMAILSIEGDLFESAAKRQAGAKDSGTLLPGHGGLLDRIDSLTSTLPLAALAWPLLAGR